MPVIQTMKTGRRRAGLMRCAHTQGERLQQGVRSERDHMFSAAIHRHAAGEAMRASSQEPGVIISVRTPETVKA
jgi:hypothetical protein